VNLPLLAALLAGLAGCASTRPRGAPDGPDSVREHVIPGTRLVVLVIIDQFPEWSLEAKRSAFTKGFARLLSEGEWRVGRHPSAATSTAPGHALLGTGEVPAHSGIIANEWWSRDENKQVTAVEGPDGETSARFLRVPGLGDAIAASKHHPKAVAVSLKARASRLPLGHAGLAIYYDGKTGMWRAHGEQAPAWFQSYTAAHPVVLAPWTPRDPSQLNSLSGTVDAQPGEVGEKGFGPTFPHDPATTKVPTDAVFAQPYGNQLVFDMAAAALDGEGLGRDGTPDLLVVSLSAHDYVAHGWGHESWEAWDMELRLDEQLGTFLTTLDTKVGTGKWSLMLTSDHGGAPLPERAPQGIDHGRIAVEQLQRAANMAATTSLGPGDWIAPAAYPYLYWNAAARTQSPANLDKAARKVVFALRAFPGLAVADRTSAYAGPCDARTDEDAKAICLAIDPERSGDFIYLPAEHWIIEEEVERLATAHGSLYDYDRNVPVLLLPYGRTSHAPATGPSSTMSLADIAPLLRAWLGL
jgi:hypothetical protein